LKFSTPVPVTPGRALITGLRGRNATESNFSLGSPEASCFTWMGGSRGTLRRVGAIWLVEATPPAPVLTGWSRLLRLKDARPAEPGALATLDPAPAGETMFGQARRCRANAPTTARGGNRVQKLLVSGCGINQDRQTRNPFEIRKIWNGLSVVSGAALVLALS